jgi:hypothetical protein
MHETEQVLDTVIRMARKKYQSKSLPVNIIDMLQIMKKGTEISI